MLRDEPKQSKPPARLPKKASQPAIIIYCSCRFSRNGRILHPHNNYGIRNPYGVEGTASSGRCAPSSSRRPRTAAKPKRILLFGLSLACPGQRSNDSLTCSSKWEHFFQPPAGTRRSISQPTALASKRVRLSPEACRYTTVRLRILTPRMTPQPTMQTTQKTARIPQLVRRWGNEYSNMAS